MGCGSPLDTIHAHHASLSRRASVWESGGWRKIFSTVAEGTSVLQLRRIGRHADGCTLAFDENRSTCLRQLPRHLSDRLRPPKLGMEQAVIVACGAQTLRLDAGRSAVLTSHKMTTSRCFRLWSRILRADSAWNFAPDVRKGTHLRPLSCRSVQCLCTTTGPRHARCSRSGS